MQLNSYLFFNGQCEAAFKFYEKCLGGKIDAMLTHAGTPRDRCRPTGGTRLCTRGWLSVMRY